MLDVEDWASGHGGRKMRGYSGPQMEMDCPFCGKARHLYMALERRVRGADKITYPGDFVCMKCDVRGRFIKIYAEIEGMDWKAARLALVGGVREPLPEKPRFMTSAAMGTVPSVYTRVAAIETLAESAPSAGISPTVDATGKPHSALPDDFQPCWDGDKWRIPAYLKERKIEKGTLAAYNIGYCDTGEYGGRIILPIDCPDGSSFTSRAIDPEAFLRYKAGPGAGRLLFGWEQAMRLIELGSQILVVVEGPFDCLSLYQAGHACVAMMGLRFKAEQVAMIASVKVRKIVMMLDETARRDAVKQAPELGSRAMIAGKLGAKDANESSPKLIRRAVDASITVESARPQLIGEAIAKLKAKMM